MHVHSFNMKVPILGRSALAEAARSMVEKVDIYGEDVEEEKGKEMERGRVSVVGLREQIERKSGRFPAC